MFISKKAALIAFVVMAALAIPYAPTERTSASDHIDSPIITQDRGSDLADTYAFLDPNDNSKVVLIMSTQGFLVSGEHFGMAIFDHNIRYRFEIENTGDAKPDEFIDVYYSKGLGRVTAQTATVVPNGKKFTAPTTVSDQEYKAPEFVITNNKENNAAFYAGVADDPFFLDDTGANRTVASAIKNPGKPNIKLLSERGRDTYAGFNTLITAVSVPASMLKGKGNVIGVNAVTQRRERMEIKKNNVLEGDGDWVTVDRDGGPLVNNGLIPPPRKDEYNGAPTTDDAADRFRADLIQSLQNFGTNAQNIQMLLNMIQVRGDILRLDMRVPNNGPGGGNNADGGPANNGGRRLHDDVADATFTLINNGQPLGDFVDRNEFQFGNLFPFVAPQVMPNPNGINDKDTRLRL